jgi:hypothetical protein
MRSKNAKVAKYGGTFAIVNYSEVNLNNVLHLVDLINPH